MTVAAGDIVFLDTNVLLIATDESRPSHGEAGNLLESAQQHGFHPGISGQIIREYLVVATRPVDANGLGLDISEALENIAMIRKRVVFFEESEQVANILVELAGDHSLSGKRIRDANVVATMMAHSITRLVTENPGDFAGFDGIETLHISETFSGN